MDKKVIATEKAPKAIGPYVQALGVGNFIFSSGQIPLDPSSGEVVSGGIEIQTRRVFENLKAVLEAADAGFEHVIKTTIFLKDLRDFATVNAVYSEYFNEPYPARSTIEVARLPKDVDIEIEVVAFR